MCGIWPAYRADPPVTCSGMDPTAGNTAVLGTERSDPVVPVVSPRDLAGMNHPGSIEALDEHNVTASDLVRHFGVWQERAARAPVYVLHRGRPRLVLTSLEIMEALCAPRSETGRGPDRIAALLDATREVVLFCDPNGRVTPASRAARAMFGADASFSAAALAAFGGDFLAAAVERVLESGIAETIEFAPAAHRLRTWSAAIEPAPDGALILCRDASIDAEAAARRAEATALDDGLAVSGGVAIARVTLRGHVEGDPRSLAALTRIDPGALATVRFPALFEVGSRVAIGEMLDGVLTDGTARALDAKVLINRGEPQRVRVAISAVRGTSAIEGGLVLLVRQGG